MQTRTERKQKTPSMPVTQRTVQRQLARAAGAEAFQYRDPLFHVTESFHQTFDRQGQRHAARLEAVLENGGGFSTPEEEEQRQTRQEGQAEQGPARTLPNTSIRLHRFSEVAFQRGSLSAAVLEGTGKMMLVSCLKYAAGQSNISNLKMRTLFDVGSQRRNVPGRDPDQMVFNRGVAGSAVGIVVDALRDARRVVLSLQEMAQGTGELKGAEGGATLRAIYPFLDDSGERELLEGYSAQLAACTDPRQVPILQNALVHTRALLEKKAQMRVELINKLRFLANRAEEALAEFEAPGFVQDVLEAVLEEGPPPAPPEDGGGEGGEHGPEPSDRPPDQNGPEAQSQAGTAAATEQP